MSEQNNDLGKIQMVSIESFDRPGCFISASVDPESDPDSGATLLTCSAVGPTALAAASFKMEEVSMGGENKVLMLLSEFPYLSRGGHCISSCDMSIRCLVYI